MNPTPSNKASNHGVLIANLSLAFILLLVSSVRGAEGLQKIRVGFASRAV